LAATARSVRQLPLTRGECVDGIRPCPFVSCKHHLYLEAKAATGSIRINSGGVPPWRMATTCSLDVADAGGTTVENIGNLLNISRERVRQIELEAVEKMRKAPVMVSEYQRRKEDDEL
jgi:hypothetical protein